MHMEAMPPEAMGGMGPMKAMPPEAMGGMGPMHMEMYPPEAMGGMVYAYGGDATEAWAVWAHQWRRCHLRLWAAGPMMQAMPPEAMAGMGPMIWKRCHLKLWAAWMHQ